MIKKVKESILTWLTKRPPKLGPDTIRVIAEDFRKAGLGLMATGVFGVMQLVPKFSVKWTPKFGPGAKL